MNKLIVIRGTAGSGKSTLAKELGFVTIGYDVRSSIPAGYLFEADDYRTVEGDYLYNKEFNKEAHGWVRYNASYQLYQNNNVCITSVILKPKDLQEYVDLAKLHGAMLIVYDTKKQYKSVHEVPETTMTKMINEFEEIGTDRVKWTLREETDRFCKYHFTKQEVVTKVDTSKVKLTRCLPLSTV